MEPARGAYGRPAGVVVGFHTTSKHYKPLASGDQTIQSCAFQVGQ